MSRSPMSDRHGLRARQPARRPRRRRRRRPERPRRARSPRARPRRATRSSCYTRRDDPDLPRRVPMAAGRRRSTTSTPGPAARCRRTTCCRHMAAFAAELARALAAEPPDVVHAHFWMSGLAALPAARRASACRWCRPSTRSARSSAATRAPPTPARPAASRAERAARPPRPTASSPPARDEVFELVAHGRARGADDGRALRRRPRARSRRTGPAPTRRAAAAALRDRRPAGAAQGRRRRRDAALAPRARTPSCSSPAARRGRLDDDPEVAPAARARRRGCGVADRVRLLGARARDAAARAAALGRRGRLRALVRAVRHRRRSRPWRAACPVVASAVGGLHDTVVRRASPALHVPPRDPDALGARRSRGCCADPTARAALGAAGRARALARYTLGPRRRRHRARLRERAGRARSAPAADRRGARR